MTLGSRRVSPPGPRIRLSRGSTSQVPTRNGCGFGAEAPAEDSSSRFIKGFTTPETAVAETLRGFVRTPSVHPQTSSRVPSILAAIVGSPPAISPVELGSSRARTRASGAAARTRHAENEPR